jgi:type IV pilus assembly protein PilV
MASLKAAPAQGQCGFSMLEVLISMFIMAVGLLGLVGMQAMAQKSELESYQRAQALILLNDIVDRINTNRKGATCYAVTTNTTNGSPYLGSAGTNKYSLAGYSCTGAGSNTAAITRAQNDLTDIDAMLRGSAEQLGTGQVGAMIGARACIGFDTNTQAYAVAVAWQGISPTYSPSGWNSAPAVVSSCAINLYGDDAQRRVVWNTVRVATLQ